MGRLRRRAVSTNCTPDEKLAISCRAKAVSVSHSQKASTMPSGAMASGTKKKSTAGEPNCQWSFSMRYIAISTWHGPNPAILRTHTLRIVQANIPRRAENFPTAQNQIRGRNGGPLAYRRGTEGLDAATNLFRGSI